MVIETADEGAKSLAIEMLRTENDTLKKAVARLEGALTSWVLEADPCGDHDSETCDESDCRLCETNAAQKETRP